LWTAGANRPKISRQRARRSHSGGPPGDFSFFIGGIESRSASPPKVEPAMASKHTSPERLLPKALAGDAPALGQLLEYYRHYLTVLARVQISRQARAKAGASDVVQETFLNAYRKFDQFRGRTEGELVAWLRAILATCVVNYVHRHYARHRRDVRLERSMNDPLDESAHLLDKAFVASQSSPSQIAVRREQVVQFANALERLPQSYRNVILLRHVQGLPFAEVARRLEKTVDAVQKLWVRGLDRLRRELEDVS
jgi:RNA polymerase sigma-70 factor (ECF subfamily)